MNPIYLDYNATTPISREVADAMSPYLYEHFGNPSSGHRYGVTTKRAVEEARWQVATMLGCTPGEVVFTSGGTESNNFAIKGAAFGNRERGSHIITTEIEHPAVLEVCRWLEGQGLRVTRLPVDGTGLVDPEALEEAITPDTVLVSIMHANNEVGTIQAIRALSDIAHAHGVLMHTDAAQSVGKVPVRVDDLGVDLLSLAGHKFYAPKGVGALYIRSGASLEPLFHGAGHEAGRRAGTENVVLVVGLGKACHSVSRRLDKISSLLLEMRERLHDGLKAELGEKAMRLNGHPEKRLPNTLSVAFRGVDANTMLAEIWGQVAASAGAACHVDQVEVSPVLQAMKVPMEWAVGTVRFSVGRHTTADQIDRAIRVVTGAVKRLSPFHQSTSLSTPSERGDTRLTQFTHGMGCACKLRPQVLEEVLQKLPRPTDPNVLVGADNSDDAAVYRLNDDTALVQTVDFFTPIVDDPYLFGAISAANSLSDIYAMGARPLFALNIVGFPSNRLPVSVLHEILEGAADKAKEAGIPIIGGHTVDDIEPKFGLAVAGVVHPMRLVRNSTAQPGDALILTKPLGVGIIATAVKRGLADKNVAKRVAERMATLNRAASNTMIAVGVNACTDVTGFGLLGHLREMCLGSAVDAIISVASVPMLAPALEYAAADVVPGGTQNNLIYVEPFVTFASNVSRVVRCVLADAQTSGGLLISLPSDRADALLKELKEAGISEAAHIGHITGKGQGGIMVS